MIFRLSDFKYLNQQGRPKGSPLSRTICTLRSFSLTLTAHPNPAPSCTKPLADVSEGFVLKVEIGGAPARWLALGPLVTPPPLYRPTQKCSRAHSDTLLSWRSLTSSRRPPTTQSQLCIPQ